MVRSGLQQDVINMYRRGVKVAMSKPKELRAPFLLHLRYSFHNPPLRPRDYTAIEHQLRRMDRTLEMLEQGSVQKMHVTPDMEEWWGMQVARAKALAEKASQAAQEGSKAPSTAATRTPDTTKQGDSAKDTQQWGGKLPGHGGT